MYAGKMPAIRGGYALSVLLGTRAKKLSKSPKKMLESGRPFRYNMVLRGFFETYL